MPRQESTKPQIKCEDNQWSVTKPMREDHGVGISSTLGPSPVADGGLHVLLMHAVKAFGSPAWSRWLVVPIERSDDEHPDLHHSRLSVIPAMPLDCMPHRVLAALPVATRYRRSGG